MALLDTARNVYYTLDGVAPLLWDRLTAGCSVDELCCAVEREFDVSRDDVQTDVSEWLREMAAAGLIVEHNA